MPADQPTILATSGGMRRGASTEIEFAPLIHFAVELSGVTGRRPRLCHVGTASGDQRWQSAAVTEAGHQADIEVTALNLFPMPPTTDLAGLVLAHDVVWVNGGSVANLLAVWRVHGLPEVLRQAWEAGVVLGGVSAGSLCWFVGGPTDSFGPDLRLVTDGLALLPYGNGVHYDSEAARRPAVHAAVASGALPPAHCTDDGAGLLYHGTTLVEAVAENGQAGAYLVERDASAETGAAEQRLDVRRLP
ncbi:peptidase E [Actinoalloteichus sp. GBA129-24]|uniref:Type 1 glutamine amidotransferase-like domain-containing protein n=1 Tax=Actinoalloteichus sp. GBA129-24 TaxID=1612551 RepID=UPI0009507B51|nr:peptidase E [Actinoalloteichus sp. GBA129-24]APU22969.1 peptidase E [Actinoalloteichus sp. GBA129-24]